MQEIHELNFSVWVKQFDGFSSDTWCDGSDKTTYDDWYRPGWYRFAGPAGTQMATLPETYYYLTKRWRQQRQQENY